MDGNVQNFRQSWFPYHLFRNYHNQRRADFLPPSFPYQLPQFQPSQVWRAHGVGPKTDSKAVCSCGVEVCLLDKSKLINQIDYNYQWQSTTAMSGWLSGREGPETLDVALESQHGALALFQLQHISGGLGGWVGGWGLKRNPRLAWSLLSSAQSSVNPGSHQSSDTQHSRSVKTIYVIPTPTNQRFQPIACC